MSGNSVSGAALAARLFARPVPQLLILDEPTNNLDLDGVEVLAEALAQWRGALLLVSHDDGFCECVGVDEVLTLPELPLSDEDPVALDADPRRRSRRGSLG